MKIKICGITTDEDGLAAAEAGADALGFNFWEGSKRRVAVDDAARIAAALPPLVARVGVFVDAAPERIEEIAVAVGLDAIQLHGDEPAAVAAAVAARGRRVIRAVRARSAADLDALAGYPASGFLVDAHVEGEPGGTGQVADWGLAREALRLGPLILAGGLTPANVAAAVRAVRPYGVDVASGVERSPGRKDPAAVDAFVRAARTAAAEAAARGETR